MARDLPCYQLAQGKVRIDMSCRVHAVLNSSPPCPHLFIIHPSPSSIIIQGKKVDFFLGMGGGKVMDVTRVAAFLMGKSHAFIPTLASTDAPGTAAAVIYRPNGTFQEFVLLPTW